MSQRTGLRGAVIGYGGAFNMGRSHLNWMRDAGIMPVAACDVDAIRVEAAKVDFPDIHIYTDVDKLLADKDVDLVTIITPHNTHADLAVKVAAAGKNMVVEKPMAITVADTTRMIEAAKKAGVVLSVFHNRRHDGDFLAIRDTIQRGLLGDVFQIQAGGGSYGHPGTWWRANKAISGGLMYDWGAHFIDWILNLMPGHKVTQVTGFLQRNLWLDQTIESHGQIIMRFDNGAVAELTQSKALSVPMPRWRILGTKGGILAENPVKDSFQLYTTVEGVAVQGTIKNQKDAWHNYYEQLAAHIKGDGPLDVTGEAARRVIAVIEAAETSSKSGKSEPVAFED